MRKQWTAGVRVRTEALFFKMIMVIFSLLLVNIFETLGTLVALVQKTGHSVEGKGTPEMKRAMMSDAIGTTVGAFLRSTPSPPTSKVLPAWQRERVAD